MNTRMALPMQLRLRMVCAVLDFMHGSGMTETMIKDTFEKGIKNLSRRLKNGGGKKAGGLEIGNENICAELLRMWHRDGRYIDNNANPRPLTLTKGRNSLYSLVRRIDAKANASQVLHEMKAVNLLRRTHAGRYLPNSDSAIVGKLHPLAIDHIAKLVVRLISTVSRNVDSTGTSLKLIERHVFTPDMDWSERSSFADFTRNRGMAYLQSVDNWLERRRIGRMTPSVRTRKKEVAASVHLFAYLGDEQGAESLHVPTKNPTRNIKEPRNAMRGKSRKGKPTSHRATRA